MYKQINNIVKVLEEDGYKKNIPKSVFCKKLMVLYGMKKGTAITWLNNFLTVGYVSIDDKDNINFVKSEFK